MDTGSIPVTSTIFGPVKDHQSLTGPDIFLLKRKDYYNMNLLLKKVAIAFIQFFIIAILYILSIFASLFIILLSVSTFVNITSGKMEWYIGIILGIMCTIGFCLFILSIKDIIKELNNWIKIVINDFKSQNNKEHEVIHIL